MDRKWRKLPSSKDRGKICAAIITILAVTVFAGILSAITAQGAGLGDTGHEVRRVQERLAQLGYYTGKENGLFSPALARSLKTYQSDAGLSVNGKTDTATLAALFDSDLPESQEELLLAIYISAKWSGLPYWEQLEQAKSLLARLKNPASPDTLAALVLRDIGVHKLLSTQIEPNARQAAVEVSRTL